LLLPPIGSPSPICFLSREPSFDFSASSVFRRDNPAKSVGSKSHGRPFSGLLFPSPASRTRAKVFRVCQLFGLRSGVLLPLFVSRVHRSFHPASRSSCLASCFLCSGLGVPHLGAGLTASFGVNCGWLESIRFSSVVCVYCCRLNPVCAIEPPGRKSREFVI
jgi:hypothetical protein